MYSFNFVLIISLILISIISWIEFYGLISKIFVNNKIKSTLIKFILKALSLIYLSFFSILIFYSLTKIEPPFKPHVIYLLSICIATDIGGLFFGKIFKGKRLTKLSPNKTISGSIGSFIISIILAPFFFLFS